MQVLGLWVVWCIDCSPMRRRSWGTFAKELETPAAGHPPNQLRRGATERRGETGSAVYRGSANARNVGARSRGKYSVRFGARENRVRVRKQGVSARIFLDCGSIRAASLDALTACPSLNAIPAHPQNARHTSIQREDLVQLRERYSSMLEYFSLCANYSRCVHDYPSS